MTGDLRSSILTTAAVAASVAGLTVIQPLTAAPPLLLAALLMDSQSAEGAGGVTDALQGKLLPADGKSAFVSFLTGPFGLWNALDGTADPELVVPSTALGVASPVPFTVPPASPLPPSSSPAEVPAAVAPSLPPGTAPLPAFPGPVFEFDLPSLQIGDAVFTPSQPSNWNIPGRPVVTSYEYNLGSYAAASLLNPFTLTNSVAAYLERTLTGSVVPVNADGTVGCGAGKDTCNVGGGVISQTTDANGVTHIKFTTASGKVVEATVETRGGVTYVTYKDSGSLPLVRPLRDYGGLLGNELADILEPALTALVYWGYRDAIGDGNALLPSVAETIRAALDFIVGVKQGLESLFHPHTPAPAEVALVPTGGEAKAGAAETTPEKNDEPPTSDSPEPPKPVAIFPEDALDHLTDLLNPPTEEPGEPAEAVEEDPEAEPVDPGEVEVPDTDETPATDDPDDTAGDSDSDGESGDTGGEDTEKPDRVKGAPNGAKGSDRDSKSSESEKDPKPSASE